MNTRESESAQLQGQASDALPRERALTRLQLTLTARGPLWTFLNGRVAAVDEQITAGHERRGNARQVDGRPGDLLGPAEAIQQVLRPHHLAGLVHVLVAHEHPSGLD